MQDDALPFRDGPLFFFEGRGVGQFSGAFDFFPICRLCMIFLVDNILCKNFFNIKNQNNDSREDLLDFSPWHDYFLFQQFMLCRIFPFFGGRGRGSGGAEIAYLTKY